MTEKKERQVLTEFIKLYRDLPCLWDLSSDNYKDQEKKNVAWGILVLKLKELEPNANIASAKQKIENLKSSYKRELRKVKDSKKRTGSGAHKVHQPSLWYYDLMQFLETKDEQIRGGTCALSSDGESPAPGNQDVKKRGHSLLKRKKKKLIETPQVEVEQSKRKTNLFGLYVGEQLDSLSTHQRQIAEKLISDVIFLAKTENLNFNSRIESRNTPCSTSLSRSSPGLSSPQYIIPSPLYNTPSSQYNTPSPQHNIPSPETRYNTPVTQNITLPSAQINTSPSSPHIQTQSAIQSIEYRFSSQQQTQPSENPTVVQISIPSHPLSQTVQPDKANSQSIIESPAGTLLKELLISKS